MRKFTLLLATFVLAVGTAGAQDYPSKPVTLVVGYAAGGTSDTATRLLADALSEELGQPVVVENRPGAATTVASNWVANQEPDGYTLYAAAVSMVLNPMLQQSVNYSPDDFAAISGMVDVPFALHVNNDLGVSNMDELIELIRSRPSELAIGTSGAGAINHLIAEYWKDALDLDVIVVHYQGDAPARQDLMAGNIHMSFTAATVAEPLITSGKTIGIAVSSEERLAELPELPTVAEAAKIDDFSATYWMAMMAPEGLPMDVLSRLREAMQVLSEDKELMQALQERGLVETIFTAEEVQARFDRQQEIYRKLINDVGLQVN